MASVMIKDSGVNDKQTLSKWHQSYVIQYWIRR